MLFGNFRFIYALIIFFFGNYSLCHAQDSLLYYNKAIQSFVKQHSIAKSQQLFQQKLDYLKRQDQLEEYYYTFFDYFLLQPNEKRLPILKNGIQKHWREPKTNDEKIAKLHIIMSIAYHLKNYGDLHNATKYYEKGFHYYTVNTIENYDIEGYCLRPLANNYTRLGDYENAIDIIKTTIAIAEKNKQPEVLISALTNLAIAYNSIGKLSESQLALKHALSNSHITKLQKGRILSQIAKNYFDLNQYDKAIIFAQKASKIIGNAHEIQQAAYKTLGIAHLKLSNFSEAENNLKKALIASQKAFGMHDREVAKTFNLLAQVAEVKKDYQKALGYYQKALQTVLPKFQPKNVYDTVPIALLYPENSIKEALDGKATVFELLNDTPNALKNYEQAFKLDALLRSVYSSQNAKLIQQSTNRIRSEKVIDLLYKLYTQTKKDSLAALAFEYAELSKSVILKEKFKAQNKYVTSDSLFLKKQQLVLKKSKITTDIKLEELKNKQANVEIIKNLIARKSKIANQLQLVQYAIDEKYPLLKDTEITKSSILKQMVPKNTLVIEYFEAAQAIYVFTIQKNKAVGFRKIIKTEKLTKLLDSYFSYYALNNGMQIKNDFEKFQVISYQIYQILLASEIKNNSTKNLLLITDGSTSFIPFDALLTSKTKSTNFQNLPYLIKTKKTSYTYSLTILKENASDNSTTFETEFNGFFPVFENNNRNLSTLYYTLKEAKQLKEFIKGNFFLKEKALKKTFLKQENSKIIHLSTHASAGNLTNPASIEFKNKTLYLPEIYGLSLNSKLLVLSACETGIGTLQKGEGVMSLARGFSYAGVKNLVVSLWKVNDKSTSTLMSNFYKEKKNNQSISTALHLAKLNYLQDNSIQNSKKTPYYWASFIHITNTIDHETPSGNTLFYVMVFLAFIIATIFFVKRN